MNVKQKIQKLIKEAIPGLYPDFKSFQNLDIGGLVDTPREKAYGDYSTNVALVLAKKLNKNPMEVAKEIVSQINTLLIRENKQSKISRFEKVEVAGPGFINFYLSKDFFIENIKKINKNFGKNQKLKNKRIIVEYTDPNILKEFHIGHLMSNTIGESVSRIVEFHGAKIKRLCYQGDVGLHVAKAIFGKMENPQSKWQEAYVFGSEKYESDEAAKKEITELNKKIYEKSDKQINDLYKKGKKESLQKFEDIYQKLGTKFNYYFFESQIADMGKKIVEGGLKKGIFEKGANGAIIFKGEKFGLHTRVFINSEGLPTYEAKELALAQEKYKKYKYDKSVVVTGNDINEYFKVLMSAMSQIFPELQKRTTHIGHGNMRLPEGKMSSRTGKVVTAEFLIGEVEKLVLEKIKDRVLSQKEKEEISEQVAIGAIKYSILKQSIGSDIIYDFEKSISFEGDSGPYLQYSNVRALSVLEKAKKERIKPSFKKVPNKIENLERLMHRFPEVVEEAGEPARNSSPARQPDGSHGGGHSDVGGKYEPHLISTYLIVLAREFNNYYAKNKIVDKNDELSPYKVALTQAFSMIMKNGLWLLGIPVPERM